MKFSIEEAIKKVDEEALNNFRKKLELFVSSQVYLMNNNNNSANSIKDRLKKIEEEVASIETKEDISKYYNTSNGIHILSMQMPQAGRGH